MRKKTEQNPTKYPAKTCQTVCLLSHTRADPSRPAHPTVIRSHKNNLGSTATSLCSFISRATKPAIAAECAEIFHLKLMQRLIKEAKAPPAKNIATHTGAPLLATNHAEPP